MLNINLEANIIHPPEILDCMLIFLLSNNNGKLRMFTDCSTLNKSTIVKSYPLPRTKKELGYLKETRYFSRLDLYDAYN